MSARAYPLQWPKDWPKIEVVHREDGSRFKGATFASALTGLQREVSLMGGKNLVLSSNYTLGAQNPKEPGVVAYFDYLNKPVAIPCDRWRKIEHNVRAIALTIEAMREWSAGARSTWITAMFQGFTALSERTGKSCWEILKVSSDATEQQILDAYRAESKTAHPDHAGGSSEAFTQLAQAKDIALATRRSALGGK